MRDKAEKNARTVKHKDGLVDTSKPNNVRALEAVGLQSAEFVRLRSSNIFSEPDERQIRQYVTEVILGLTTMQCAIRRRFPGRLLRGFSSSAPRHEIRDVAGLAQRLIPKYQGAALAHEGWFGGLLCCYRNPGRVVIFTMASAASERPVGAQRLRPGGD